MANIKTGEHESEPSTANNERDEGLQQAEIGPLDETEREGGLDPAQVPAREADVDVTENGALSGTDLGRRMRQLADVISRSQEGQNLRVIARRINLSLLNRPMFYDILRELFGDGFTMYRFLVLLIFCADILIGAFERGSINLLMQLTSWIATFVTTTLASRIREIGGWVTFIRTSIRERNRAAGYAAAAFGLFAVISAIFVRGGLR